MNETQNWYESKTIRAGVVTLVTTIMTIVQALSPGKIQQSDVEVVNTQLPILMTACISLVTTGVMIWGRIVATKKIGGEK